jgi:hypothetical protein
MISGRRALVAAFAVAAAAIGLTSAGYGEGPGTPDGSVRRLSEAQYRASIADAFGADIKIAGRFEPDLRVDGLAAVGSSAVSITSAGFDQYELIARNIADQVVDPDHRDRLVGCAPQPSDPAGSACAARFFATVGSRLFRRPLAPAEQQAYAAAAIKAGTVLGGFHPGLAAALAAMLSSPEFLFQIDRRDAAGQIDGWSRATRLSFFLWNGPPDKALLEAAARGDLATDAGVAAQVDRMIAAPAFESGVRAFFSDFLLLDDLDSLPKDSLIYPQFSTSVAQMLKEQTLRTLVDELVTRRGDYRDVFTSPRIAMRKELGPIYRVPVAGTDWSIHEFPAGDPRAGLLTHASLLALHSHPGRTSPTLRGKAIRETLLCQKIPSPPANVNFAVVQDVNNPTLKTTRERLKAHLDDDDCAGCHKLTDPIGLGFEQFDGAGVFRAIERGEPIDPSGVFDGTEYRDAAALGRLFHDSAEAASCIVSSTWRYASGRNPQEADEPGIASLEKRFAGSGYRLADLMRMIAIERALDRATEKPPGSKARSIAMAKARISR